MEALVALADYPVVSRHPVADADLREITQMMLQVEETVLVALHPRFIEAIILQDLPAAHLEQGQVELHVHMAVAVFPFRRDHEVQLHRQLADLVEGWETVLFACRCHGVPVGSPMLINRG